MNSGTVKAAAKIRSRRSAASSASLPSLPLRAVRLFRRRRIAGRGDRLGDPGRRHRLGDIGDIGFFGGEIDAGVDHARQLLQRALDAADAGRASHAADGEGRVRQFRFVTGALDRIDQGLRIDLGRIGHDPRLFRREIDIGRNDTGHLLQRPFDPADAARAAHALDLQRQIITHLAHLHAARARRLSGTSKRPSARRPSSRCRRGHARSRRDA